MISLLTSQQMKDADRYTIDKIGIPEILLMEHAADGVFRRLKKQFGAEFNKTAGILLCGPGNNGGDGLAVARLLALSNFKHFKVVEIAEDTGRSVAFQMQKRILENLGISTTTKYDLETADWVVDGIFGTGLSKPLEGIYLKTVEALNRTKSKYILSIDIPSGLSADTGQPMKAAVRATDTVSLGFYKRGLFTGVAADYVGELSLKNIQIPQNIPGIQPRAFLFTEEDARETLPSRSRSSNKGNFGHVYVLAGEENKQGACGLAAMSVLRTGAGLVTVLGTPDDLAKVRPRLPLEVMTQEIDSQMNLKENSTLVIGPGLGETAKDWATVKTLLRFPLPAVVDASALNLMSQYKTEAKELFKQREKHVTVITPHPKEASRLLGVTMESVQADRFSACQMLQSEFGCYVLLKGRGSIAQGKDSAQIVINQGNTVLAKGGSGDILSGMIASLIAQGVSAIYATALGAFLHGKAAEIVAKEQGNERSGIATEIIDAIRI